MAVFRARYKGTCEKCKASVEPGQYVSWSRRQRGIIYHARCIGETEPDAQQAPSDGETQAQAQTEQPAPTPQIPGVSEKRVREIAQEEDAGQLGKLLHAVEERLDKRIPRELVIRVHEKDGEIREVKRVSNAHMTLVRLVYLIQKRRHAYLFGPPGSGKSTGAVQAAQALDMRYGYVSLNPQTPESRLLGFIDAGGVYRETEFFRCYVNGGVFCIDELDNGHPALLNTLNGMLETDHDGIGRGAFPCGVVERHKDFVCVATGNTNGRGGDKLFPERRALDAAFMERFAFLAWGYDEALEQAITIAANPEHGLTWLKWTRTVRAFVAEHGIRVWVSPRASVGGATLLRDSGWTTREIADAVLFKGLDADTVERIVSECPLPEVA
jgi:dynein-related subfamily AAA family protein